MFHWEERECISSSSSSDFSAGSCTLGNERKTSWLLKHLCEIVAKALFACKRLLRGLHLPTLLQAPYACWHLIFPVVAGVNTFPRQCLIGTFITSSAAPLVLALHEGQVFGQPCLVSASPVPTHYKWGCWAASLSGFFVFSLLCKQSECLKVIPVVQPVC